MARRIIPEFGVKHPLDRRLPKGPTPQSHDNCIFVDQRCVLDLIALTEIADQVSPGSRYFWAERLQPISY